MPRSLDSQPTQVADSAIRAVAGSQSLPNIQEQPSTQREKDPEITVVSQLPLLGVGELCAGEPFADELPLEHDFGVRFERHELIGRGGFGRVYRAYDRKLGRFVAVKVPHRGSLDGVSNRRQVEREAAATARLRHPHIVTLHDFVAHGDHSLLINELIEGETLAQFLARFRQGCDVRVAATVVQRIAQAVQHAHDHHVLHRDIKPSNILLDTTVADGELPFCPRLTDFGVARILRDDDGTETSCQFVGTWHYTPPELLSQKPGSHTCASDIYSLGVVFYELLTGRRPFDATVPGNLHNQIRSGNFVSPRVLRAEVPRDLEAICLRCMATHPRSRYASAGDLAADLTRFLKGEPVIARLPGAAERLVRWMRRYPTQAAVVSISAAALVTVMLTVAVMNRELSQKNAELQVTNQQLKSALEAERRTSDDYEQMIYAGDMSKAAIAIQETRLRDARAILDRYANGEPLARHRDVEWEHAQFQISRDSTIVWNTAQALYCIVQSNRMLAVGGAASEITLLDRTSGDVIDQWQTGQTEVNSIVLDPETEWLWCSGDDGSVHAYDIRTQTPIFRAKVFENALAFDLLHFPDLQQLICFSSDGSVAAIDHSTGEIRRRWSALKQGTRSIAFAGQRHFAVGDFEGYLRIYDVVTGKLKHELELEGHKAILVMRFDPETQRLWVLAENSICYLDLKTTTFSPPWIATDELTAMVCEPTGRSIVVAMAGGIFQRLQIADDGSLSPTDRWANEGQRVFAIEADRDGGKILSTDDTGALRKWHSAPLMQAEHRGPEKSKSLQFDFIPGSENEGWPELVSINRTQVFSLPTDTGQRQPLGYQGPPPLHVSAVAKQQLLIGNAQPPAQLLDFVSGTTTNLSVHGSGIAKRSNDLRWLCGVEPKLGYAWLLDAADQTLPERLPAHHAHAITVASEFDRVFWNDDNALVSRRLVSTDAPRHHATFSRVPKFLELSYDQRLIAVGLTDREVHLWDWQRDQRSGPVLMHHGRLHALAFSQGGRTLMTLDDAAVLRFWNIKTAQLMLEKPIRSALSGDITYARFSPDARFLVLLYNRQHFVTLRLY